MTASSSSRRQVIQVVGVTGHMSHSASDAKGQPMVPVIWWEAVTVWVHLLSVTYLDATVAAQLQWSNIPNKSKNPNLRDTEELSRTVVRWKQNQWRSKER
jgi:hypothetical protein